MLTALAEEWLNTAREMALQRPGERLDPPATAVLDELPNATPIPGLPAIVSDSAGRGVLIHWAAQSKAQLDDTFSRTRAAMLLDNTTLMAVWGGLKDASTLVHCAACQPHQRVATVVCELCGDGPLLVNDLAAAETDEPAHAVVRTWLITHGWLLSPRLPCPDHPQAEPGPLSKIAPRRRSEPVTTTKGATTAVTDR